MNRRNFITELGIGLIATTSLKSFGDINDTWIPVLASDRENTNGRIYPLDVVISIKKQIESLVDKKLCFVSLCVDETQVSSVVNLRNVSGLIDDVKFEHNGILFVKWHLLKTPSGEAVKNSLKDLYLVTSGIGELHDNVVSNYTFAQFIISPDSSWENHFKKGLV